MWTRAQERAGVGVEGWRFCLCGTSSGDTISTLNKLGAGATVHGQLGTAAIAIHRIPKKEYRGVVVLSRKTKGTWAGKCGKCGADSSMGPEPPLRRPGPRGVQLISTRVGPSSLPGAAFALSPLPDQILGSPPVSPEKARRKS